MNPMAAAWSKPAAHSCANVALDKTTVQMQAIVREELLETQAILRQEAAKLQAVLRKEAAELEALRQDVQRSIQALKALQPGIERSAGAGVRNAISGGMDELRRDLNVQISGSAETIGNAARQVQGMVRQLTPLWAGLIAAAGLVLGIVSLYFFAVQGRDKSKRKSTSSSSPRPLQLSPLRSLHRHPRPAQGAFTRRCMDVRPLYRSQGRNRKNPRPQPRISREPIRESRLWI